MRTALVGLGLAALALGGACGGGAFEGGQPSGGQATGAQSGGGSGGSANAMGGKTSAGAPQGGASFAGTGAMPGGSSSGAAGGASGGVGGAPVQPPNECPCAPPTPTCQAGRCVARGPTMIKSGAFYVDSTEVTVAQYESFLKATNGDVSGQAPECSWNDSFEPSAGDGSPRHPVTHVDFCDATAFCAWADKQLCGKIGGGTLLISELPAVTKSQWAFACGGSKGQPFPYGTAHEAGQCNDDSGSGSVADVASFEGCNGFARGVFDMVGNVAEWVAACDASQGSADGCETTGGSYADALGCSGSGLKHRDEQLPNVGFRCCSQ